MIEKKVVPTKELREDSNIKFESNDERYQPLFDAFQEFQKNYRRAN